MAKKSETLGKPSARAGKQGGGAPGRRSSSKPGSRSAKRKKGPAPRPPFCGALPEQEGVDIFSFAGCPEVTVRVVGYEYHSEAYSIAGEQYLDLHLHASAPGRVSQAVTMTYPLDCIAHADGLVRDFASFGVTNVDGGMLEKACEAAVGKTLRLSALPDDNQYLADVAVDAPQWEPDPRERDNFYGFLLCYDWITMGGSNPEMPPRPGMTPDELSMHYQVPREWIDQLKYEI